MCYHNLMPPSRRPSQRRPCLTQPQLRWKALRKRKQRPTLLLTLSFLCPPLQANICSCQALRPEMSHTPLMSYSYSVNAGQRRRNISEYGIWWVAVFLVAVEPVCPTDILTIRHSTLCPLYLSVNLLLLL